MADLNVSHDSKNGEETEDKRIKWSGSFEFILSLIGYGVGLGNIWRFPYLCAKYGGAVFLIPYAVYMVLLAFPLTFLELSLGQFSGKSTYDVWDICPAVRGIGVAMTMLSGMCALYYNAILAWILYYFVHSFMSPLPWTTCNNWWNTERCIVHTAVSHNSTLSSLNNTNQSVQIVPEVYNVSQSSNFSSGLTASEEFWNYNLLRISPGIHEMGSMQWHLVVSLTVAWIIIFLCIIKGVKSVGKVVYVTAVAPYILITIILIRAVTLPGASKGIIYYIVPDFSKLANPEVWTAALMQMFFSMGMGWGGFITMASYNKFSNNVMRDSIIYSFMCEGTSFYAGFVVFSVLGYLSNLLGVEVVDVIRTGPGLAFITYPEALSLLPLPQLWAVLFFLMLAFVSVDSMFVNVEVCVTTIADLIPNITAYRRLLLTGVICLLMFLVDLIYTTNGGIYVFQLADWFIAAFTPFLICIVESIVIGWIYGADRYFSDIEVMLGKKPVIILKFLWCIVDPIILLGVLLYTLIGYPLPTYGKYTFPHYANVIGWLIATISSVPIPIWLIKEIYQRKGPLLQRVKEAFTPNERWGPSTDLKLHSLSSDDDEKDAMGKLIGEGVV